MEGYDVKYILEGLFRWAHVVAGVLWIGMLYFFNFVNANFAPTMDGDTKKKVVPQLMPRALYFFRWGAAFTWITGVLVMGMAYYMGSLLFEADRGWGAWAFLIIAITFVLGFLVYDLLAKKILKDNRAMFWVGWVLATSMLYLGRCAGFSFRGYAIHLGAMLGTIMAANVWMRIWPAQQKIINAVKNGEKPDDATVALAGTRSKHNTFMSVPLLFLMISKSSPWAAKPWILSLIILGGWGFVHWMYKKAKTVPGF